MIEFRTKCAQALRVNRAKLAHDEVTQDFPLLRLNKSTEAYRIIASYLTVPLEERLVTALAFATFDSERTDQQRILVEAFRSRMAATMAERK